ncbi:kinase-regulated stress-responsive transcription factor SKN7 NDAI_0D03430 [Naumovozyma dairenensis CBS 421]|uniref:Transcription factor n=1 Tax=Naumovozyma dairenensis (strain ATCC 10597 / BCRC 20456 / CBS 421 / NBRC 0211 / NRRL Y-12639) TaxID=1071378 RepID=G0WA46_NAUDC|nr:hypothetical protein NDAI_0D03430 [Naumovozyma dairenensis CBS 421]CCD24657.1 hypothetical protein NDAI_0D03430 [Naumovozyma dairenensis CBS 421]
MNGIPFSNNNNYGISTTLPAIDQNNNNNTDQMSQEDQERQSKQLQQLPLLPPAATLGTANNNVSSSSGTPTGSHGSKAANNDFVRKLYKILETNTFPNLVRWTPEGTSFVVLDTGKFTTQILPTHFKHSNFSSFVRQLNKYDFHKVKRKSDEPGRKKYGELSWEFTHPSFKRHDEAGLENIKRKIANSRKPDEVQPVTVSTKTSDILKVAPSKMQFDKLKSDFENMERTMNDMMTKYTRTQDELTRLTNRYNTLVESLFTFKTVNENVVNNFTTLCSTLSQKGIELPPSLYDSNKLNQLATYNPLQQQQLARSSSLSLNAPSIQSILAREPVSIQTPTDKQIQHQPAPHNQQIRNNHNTTAATTPLLQNTLPLISTPAGGILPLQEENINTTGHSVSSISKSDVDIKQENSQSPTATEELRKGYHVLLVEDDAVSIQLCSKFLRKSGCTVEVVTDGLAAISILEAFRYDLVLMDIVMPNLDGATATSIIRNFDKETPIIAMTGNIEDQDLITYLQHGMTDILAKPFTRDDLLSMLIRHLSKRIPLCERQQSEPPIQDPSQEKVRQQLIANGPSPHNEPLKKYHHLTPTYCRMYRTIT